MSQPTTPKNIYEAIERGCLGLDEPIHIQVAGMGFAIPAKHCIRASRLRDDLFAGVVARKALVTAVQPYSIIRLSYDRDDRLFEHIRVYLVGAGEIVCTDPKTAHRLVEEAHFYGLDDLAAKYDKIAGGSLGIPHYFRVTANIDHIRVPAFFSKEAQLIAARVDANAKFVVLSDCTFINTQTSVAVADSIVSALIAYGYYMLTANNISDATMYHFKSER